MVFHDVTEWLRATCAELAPGEMIKPDNLQLLDAMNAVEVGQHKTDTGLLNGIKAPPGDFDPFMPLTAEELCWIIDRLVQLELAWYQGTPICLCVYTSLYFHNFQHLFTQNQDSPSRLVAQLDLEEISPRPAELITIVLKAYILSYRKTLDLVFVELAKGNVVDGEDCWLDDYGLGIVMLDHVEEVLELGASSEAWLSSEGCTVEEPWRKRLLVRLRFRNRLLNSIARLTEPPTWPRTTSFGIPELRTSFNALSSLAPTTEPSADSPARSAFDDRIFSALRQHMPLPKVEVMDSAKTLMALKGLVEGVKLAEVLGRTEDFATWELALRGKLWSGPPILAFVRSLLISTFSPTRETLFRHGLSIDWLADAWLSSQAGLPPGGMRTLSEALQGTGSEIMALPSFRRWRDILTGNLVNNVTISLYNRPRHRRNQLSSSLTFAELADDARAYARATVQFPPSVSLSIDAMRLDSMLEGALLGWELDLVDRGEEREAWWWVKTVSERRLLLALELGKKEEDWRVAFAELMAAIASGMIRMLTVITLHTGSATEFSEAMQRRAFALRHKRALKQPFGPPNAVRYEERLYPDFDTWWTLRAELDAREASQLRDEADGFFENALHQLQPLERLTRALSNVRDWDIIIDGLRDDLRHVMRGGNTWDWNERVSRSRGSRWLLRLV